MSSFKWKIICPRLTPRTQLLQLFHRKHSPPVFNYYVQPLGFTQTSILFVYPTPTRVLETGGHMRMLHRIQNMTRWSRGVRRDVDENVTPDPEHDSLITWCEERCGWECYTGSRTWLADHVVWGETWMRMLHRIQNMTRWSHGARRDVDENVTLDPVHDSLITWCEERCGWECYTGSRTWLVDHMVLGEMWMRMLHWIQNMTHWSHGVRRDVDENVTPDADYDSLFEWCEERHGWECYTRHRTWLPHWVVQGGMWMRMLHQIQNMTHSLRGVRRDVDERMLHQTQKMTRSLSGVRRDMYKNVTPDKEHDSLIECCEEGRGWECYARPGT